MAQIDPNIALSIRPAQIESPLVHAARAAELQGSQQTQFMNMLKMKEYVDESRTKNELKKWLSGKTAQDLDQESTLNELATKFGAQGLALAKQIDDRRKAQGEAEYRQAQITDLKSQGTKRIYDLNKSQNEDAIKTISGFTRRQDAIDMLYQSEASGTLSREAAENIRRTIPDNEEEFPAFKQNLIERLMSADERVRQSNRQQDRAAPKWELRKIGDREVPVNVNPYSETVGQIKPGAEALVDDTPKPEKFDLNGKIVTRDMNPNSGTYLQIISTDEKTAAPAAIVESSLAKLVREREALPKDSPMLKIYDDAISKETGGAPPALVQEYLYAQKNNGFKGTLLDFKKQVAMAGRNVTNNPAAITPVTIVDPNNPDRAIVVNGRDGRVIGQAIKEPSGVQLSAKEKQNREAKYPQATAAVKTYETKSEQLARDLETLANHPGLDGISGAIYGRLPSGTKDSMAAQEKYNAIVARGGFTELADMRASSPTGGALGNVSNQEGQYLRDAFASIGRTQSRDDLKAALIEAAKRVRESKGRIREAYDMTYEYRDGGQTTPAAPKSDIQNKADAVLRGAK